MKLEDTRSAYETLSGKASDIVRQLSLAGIAVIWLFKSGTEGAPVLDKPLVRAALFIFLALLLDLLQYLLGSAIWFLYFRHMEKGGAKLDTEVEAPESLNWPTWFLFAAKAAMMLVAYICYIIPFLAAKFMG